MRLLEIHSDAGCDNKLLNSPMGVGYHANTTTNEIRAVAFNAGIGTSNVGEWIGAICAIAYATTVAKEYDKIIFYLDSQLVVNQLTGEYQVKKPHLVPFKAKSLELLNQLPIGKWEIRWVRREYNQRADDLSKEGLKLPYIEIPWLEKIYKPKLK